MPYVYLDAPADSADLETLGGYQIARLVAEAKGGPVAPPAEPETGGQELLLAYPEARSYLPRPVTVARAARRGAGLSLPASRAGRGRWTWKLAPTGALASLLVVPALCFVAVWLLGSV